MFSKVDEIQQAHERLEMAIDLLFAVIERTGDFREGFYALRMLTEHTRTLNHGAFALEAETVSEAVDAYLTQVNNLIATVNTQIERIDA